MKPTKSSLAVFSEVSSVKAVGVCIAGQTLVTFQYTETVQHDTGQQKCQIVNEAHLKLNFQHVKRRHNV